MEGESAYSAGTFFVHAGVLMSENILQIPRKGVTLSQHLSHQQKLVRASGEFSMILSQIALAGKLISRALSHAGIYEKGGYTGAVNVQGEQQTRMDVFANETFIRVFSHSPWVSTLVSEEMENPMHLHDKIQGGKYVVCVDPLDGSSNLDNNGVIGSIFSVLRRVDTTEKATERDLLQKGTEQVAAGYLMYGPATMLVYTVGNGVDMYMLDKSIGEFLICKEDIRIPERGLSYACNEAHYHEWTDDTRRFIEYLRRRDMKSDKHYSARYAGALVADFHRTLIEGGVYLYPAENPSGEAPEGKLRLIYECNPLAFIAEQCGGKATTGTERILKIHPVALHQRVPLVIGSPYEVLLYEDFVQGKR
jgi:fructose-1,6-bisphosphatase I